MKITITLNAAPDLVFAVPSNIANELVERGLAKIRNDKYLTAVEGPEEIKCK